MTNKYIFSLLLVSLTGVGCLDLGIRTNMVPPVPARPMTVYEKEKPSIVLPLDGNIAGYMVTYKGFGEYIQDRFTGYHVGEDIEILPEDFSPGETQEVPIRSIAEGKVVFVDWVSGYGGLVIIRHTIDEEIVNSLYGHMDLSSVVLRVDESVDRGQFIGNLGEGNTKETDQERQHLHFALYEGEEIRKNGYERKIADVRNWINPTDFFMEYNLLDFRGFVDFSNKMIPLEVGKIFPLSFLLPDGWDAEYIPSIKAVNLYTLSGDGTARERSQIFMRYFDADQFLTLSTVTVYSTQDVTVGGSPIDPNDLNLIRDQYSARRYDIEKKSAVPDFVDQPLWRNKRHFVTDFRAKEGKTRYYVIAANPELDPEIYEQVLKSMEIK